MSVGIVAEDGTSVILLKVVLERETGPDRTGMYFGSREGSVFVRLGVCRRIITLWGLKKRYIM